MAVQAAQDAKLALSRHLQGGLTAWKANSGPIARRDYNTIRLSGVAFVPKCVRQDPDRGEFGGYPCRSVGLLLSFLFDLNRGRIKLLGFRSPRRPRM